MLTIRRVSMVKISAATSVYMNVMYDRPYVLYVQKANGNIYRDSCTRTRCFCGGLIDSLGSSKHHLLLNDCTRHPTTFDVVFPRPKEDCLRLSILVLIASSCDCCLIDKALSRMIS